MAVSPDNRVLGLARIRNPWERKVVSLLSYVLGTGEIGMGDGTSPRYSYKTTEGGSISLELVRETEGYTLQVDEEIHDGSKKSSRYGPLHEVIAIDPGSGIVAFCGPGFYVEARPQGFVHPRNL